MDISRFLPDNQYQAALNANLPTALNPFATINDISGFVSNNIYTADDTLTGNRIVTGGGNNLTFTGIGSYLVSGSTITLNSAAASLSLGAAPGDWSLTGGGSGTITSNTSLSISSTSNNVSIQGLVYPNADGNANDVLITNGVGTLSFVDVDTIVTLDGNGIYDGSGTVPTTTIVTLTDSLTFQGGSVVFNETALSTGDVRIEGVTDVNLLFTDASTNRVALGLAGPTAKLHVRGNGTGTDGTIYAENQSSQAIFIARDDRFVGLRVSTPALTENMRLNGEAFITQGGLAISSGNTLPASGATWADFNSGLVSSGAVFALNAGPNTNNNNFKIYNDSDPDLLNVYTGGGAGSVGIMTATASISSTLTVTGDIEAIGTTKGLILQDRTSGTRYRIYIDSTGTLFTEAA